MNAESSWKIGKRCTIGIIIIDVIILLFNLIMVMTNHYSASKISALILFQLLVPITAFLLIFTGITNLVKANTEKRTIKQELEIKQRFWGRMSLLGISVIILLIYNFLMPWDIYGLIAMVLLFILSIYLGPTFGKKVIKN